MNGGLLNFSDDDFINAPKALPVYENTPIKPDMRKSDEVKKRNFGDIMAKISTPLSEFDKTTQWLEYKDTQRFLAKGSINTVSARSGIGKTFLSVALAIELLNLGVIKRVIHFNFDGNTSIFGSRNQSEPIKAFVNTGIWQHVRADELYNVGFKNIDEVLSIGLKEKSDFNGVFIILDSLVNFCPKLTDTEATTKFYQLLRNIAELGAIFWINTHVKKGEAEEFLGSQMIEALSDARWGLTADKRENEILYSLEIKKGRDRQENQAFKLNTATGKITPMSYEETKTPSIRNSLVNQIKVNLKDNEGGLTQGELLQKLGRSKDDKTAREILNELDGDVWTIEKIGKEKLVKLI